MGKVKAAKFSHDVRGHKFQDIGEKCVNALSHVQAFERQQSFVKWWYRTGVTQMEFSPKEQPD